MFASLLMFAHAAATYSPSPAPPPPPSITPLTVSLDDGDVVKFTISFPPQPQPPSFAKTSRKTGCTTLASNVVSAPFLPPPPPNFHTYTFNMH